MKKYILLFGLITASLFGSMNLNVFESQFHKAYQEGEFQSALQMRSSNEEVNLRLKQKFEFEVQKLQEERNKALLDLYEPNSDLEISKRIQRIAAFRLTSLQADSLKYMASLKSKPLNSSNSPLENQLIAIDAEYGCKNLYIDLLFTQSKLTLVEKKGMKVFYKIERMHKMLEAANASTEHSIARLVEEADLILGPYQAYRDDVAAIEALAKGTATPANPLEDQVKVIELAHQAKIQELQAKFLAIT